MIVYANRTKSLDRAYGALNSLNRYDKNEHKMRWGTIEGNDYGLPDWQYARIKIYEAFGCGYINWNMLNLALDKTEAASNDSWMFDYNYRYLIELYSIDGKLIYKNENVKVNDIQNEIMETGRIFEEITIIKYLKSIQNQSLNERKKIVLSGSKINKKIEIFNLYITRTA